MSTRVVVRGQTFFANDTARREAVVRQKRKHEIPRDRSGQVLQDERSPAAAISPNSAASPFRAGVGYFCKEDRLTYRVVSHVDPTEGWAPSHFWKSRWLLTHGEVLALARDGLLDAVMLEQSQVRRFRCRDEARVLRSETVLRAALLRKRAALAQAKPGAPQQKPRVSGNGAHPPPRRVNGQWVK